MCYEDKVMPPALQSVTRYAELKSGSARDKDQLLTYMMPIHCPVTELRQVCSVQI